MTENNQDPRQPEQWDEPRLIVTLIGICLLLEGALIYYQAGPSQTIVAGITGISGITLLLFAWLVPLGIDIEEKPAEISDEPVTPEPLPEKESVDPDQITEAEKTEPVENKSIPPTKKTEEPVEAEPAVEIPWHKRLRHGLKKTRQQFVGRLKKLVLGTTKIDDDLMEELEGTLFEGDLGVKITQELLEFLERKVEEDEIKDPQKIYEILCDRLRTKLTRFSSEPNFNENGLTVFLIIGVNGVGKTTTIAKLARRFTSKGKKVILAAGDTFRAAAIDQLTIWAERAGAEIIRGNEGGDPGALVFDAIHAARKREADLLLIDTAGRMHVKTNLMAELKKIHKIVKKETDGGPHEILLVLDATTGQNAVQQAKLFHEALPISGLVLTKLDGTAKGGVLFAVEEEINAPVRFIGIGEKMDDLMPFDPEEFLSALFSEESDKKKESDYKVL